MLNDFLTFVFMVCKLYAMAFFCIYIESNILFLIDINIIQKALRHDAFKSIMTKFVIKNKFRHLYNRAVLFE